jgi:DNA-binding beta-propeller fold protein YncE
MYKRASKEVMRQKGESRMNEKNKKFVGFRNIVRVVATIVAGTLLLAGCATPKPKQAAVFFPPPPNEPKIQFLKSVSGSKDVEESQSDLALLLAGGNRDNGKPIARPYGVQYVNGKLYVCDLQGSSTVIIIDFKKKTFEYLKENPGFGKLKKPINLAVDKDGSLFVVDTIKREVMIYDPTGKFVGSMGKELNMKPVDVAMDNDFIYVLDLKDSDIKVFDRKSRQLARTIGKTSDSSQNLAMPTNFTIDDKGLIYVTNIQDASVKIYDKDGHFISSFGKIGDAFGEFTRPKGITVDSQMRVWVVDSAFQNVQVFNENHKVLMFFGDPPLLSGGMNLPAGIAVTTEDLGYFQQFAAPDFILDQVVFVTNQMGDAMVSIYGLGHKKDASEIPKQQGAGEKSDEKKPSVDKSVKPGDSVNRIAK